MKKIFEKYLDRLIATNSNDVINIRISTKMAEEYGIDNLDTIEYQGVTFIVRKY